MSDGKRDELACTYAALILHDEGLEVTAEKLATLVKAANITDMQPYWPGLFAKVLKSNSIDDLILSTSGGAAAGGDAPAAAGDAAAEAEPEPEEEEEEESEADLGGGG
eukprot:CAMPEP_0168538224 /NCGR_PEP_ID=MMETSP0405-20121227/20952_1 /TAXON_ID=498012 /ORGANISM="Trichosphaerium sp, Strain Am-I-7 wt" /LENGTH=107 /DNA_ID=CAMNT_0008567249 /DNA_START=136 /DNA_END=456 /DNA_ORIENTATION=+